MSSESSGKRPVFLYLIPVIAVAAIVIFIVSRPDPKPDDGDGKAKTDQKSDSKTDKVASKKVEKRSIEETARLIALKDRSVALIENDKTNEAAPIFEQLARELPDEKFGYQNLAIAWLLQFEGLQRLAEREKYANASDKATAAVAGFRDKFGEDAVALVLSARLAYLKGRDPQLKPQQSAQQIAQLTAASKLLPKDACVWFTLFNAGQHSRDKVVQSTAHRALQEAYKLEPGNIFVLVDQITIQHKNQDPTIVKTLGELKTLISPYADAIERNRGKRYDVIQYIDDAVAAIKQSDWKKAQSPVFVMGRLIRPETVSRIDLRRIDRHVLEYLEHDFSPSFYQSSTLPQSKSAEPISVTFKHTMTLDAAKGAKQLQLTDYDLDGSWDLVVTGSSGVHIFTRKTGANEVTPDSWNSPITIAQGEGHAGVVIADFDRDYEDNKITRTPEMKADFVSTMSLHDSDVDFVTYGTQGLEVFQNSVNEEGKDRKLTSVKQGEGVSAIRNVVAAKAVDLDHDGDLDIVASTDSGIELLVNMGNMTFKRTSKYSQLPPQDAAASVILPLDWDRDVAVEVILAGSALAKNGFLDNLMHGQFRWHAFDDNFDLTTVSAIAVGEFDANVSWDFVTANEKGIAVTLTSTLEAGKVTVKEKSSISDFAAQGVKTLDFDNDGFVDVFAWNDSQLRLFRNSREDGKTSFSEVAEAFEGDFTGVTSCEVIDIEGDGDLDICVATESGIQILTNDGGNQNNWISIVARAQGESDRPSLRTNMYGIGSFVEIKAGGTYQTAVIQNAATHFGLGKQDKADIVRMIWTNGAPTNRLDASTKATIWEQQDLLGSCPYLYTWDGEKFVFVTDLLWAAPIGLQLAEGVFAPSREWEYLKVPGEKLKPKDGEYVLQLTEELWEAAYFDEVKLLAIDHPADVEIFSNEKVGPAEIAEFKIHTVKNARVPESARDQRGRDVLPEIAQRDGRYLKGYDRKLMQGLTEEHFIELDLGKLDDPQQITLFLTGWIFPTDTSLNVGISQNPDVASPKPPSLWVLDKDGRWRNVMPYMGFPGGKTKTIAVDLSNVFLTDEYKVRVSTSMEIYWDTVFFTVDEGPVDIRQTELPLVAADLHYRGFSRRIEHPGNGPENYDYASVSKTPKWAPMGGRFTRFGDVTELVRVSDDQLLVMGSGDEMTIRFKAETKPLPDGWKRDFILYNVGWDKDANMNTLYGQTVEPLPFRAMKGYPGRDGRDFPNTEFHQQYLEQYQTRTQSYSRFWRNIREFAK